LLYWATTTPNIGMDYRISSHSTISVTIGYNAIKFLNRVDDRGIKTNPKLHHWLVVPEANYWFKQAFEKHYIGIHALCGKYNVGGLKFPAFLKNARMKGWGVGGGITYGYRWKLGRRWGMEASVGIGYAYLRYSKYDCGACGKLRGKYTRNWFGPTKASFSFIYYIP